MLRSQSKGLVHTWGVSWHWQAGRQRDTNQGLMANSCLCPITERSPPPVRPFCHTYSSSQPMSQSLPLVRQPAKEEVHEQEGKGVSQGTPYSGCQENRTHQETATMGRDYTKSCFYPQIWELQRQCCSPGIGWLLGTYPTKANIILQQ